jgi:hypothetical protein
VSRAALLLLALICAALLAACGEKPDKPPPIFKVKAPHGIRPTEFPDVGMNFTRPRNWTVRRREPPGVFELVSGEAVIAGWAYPRDEPLPETDAELEGAKNRLRSAIHDRDPNYRIERADIRELANAPAIDISGEQVLSRRTLRTRSVHVYKGDVEYVIEAIAPPGDYDAVEQGVLTPLLDSLELTGKVDEGTG